MEDALTRALWTLFLVLLIVALIGAIAETVAKKTGEFFIVALLTVILFPIALAIRAISQSVKKKREAKKAADGKPPDGEAKPGGKKKDAERPSRGQSVVKRVPEKRGKTVKPERKRKTGKR